MPTPHDDITVLPATPPNELASSRASFASCPPEDERGLRAPRESRASTSRPDQESDTVGEDEHAIRQVATPESDAHAGAFQRDGDKAEHVEDAGVPVSNEMPSSQDTSTPELSSDADFRFAQTSTNAPVRPDEEDTATLDETAPLYLYYPPTDKDRVGVLS
jgi:hypothetical protein